MPTLTGCPAGGEQAWGLAHPYAHPSWVPVGRGLLVFPCAQVPLGRIARRVPGWAGGELCSTVEKGFSPVEKWLENRCFLSFSLQLNGVLLLLIDLSGSRGCTGEGCGQAPSESPRKGLRYRGRHQGTSRFALHDSTRSPEHRTSCPVITLVAAPIPQPLPRRFAGGLTTHRGQGWLCDGDLMGPKQPLRCCVR